MMLAGVFMDIDGNIHQFYEIEEPYYYRLDICKQGGSYHIDPSCVEYSIFKKKKILVYGDKEIYNEYSTLKENIFNARGDESEEARWDEGKYYVVKTKEDRSHTIKCRTVIINGSVSNMEAYYNGQLFQYTMMDGGVAKMDPLNIMDYEEMYIASGDASKASYTTPYYPYDVLIKRYDLQHILDRDFHVASPDDADMWLEEWYTSDARLKGFDTETTGLDIWKFGDDVMVGIILSIGKETSIYFPFRMELIDNLSMEFLDKLMKYCIEQQDRLVAHNKKFDRQVMLKEGYDLQIKWCSMILSCMLNPVTEKGAHALKPNIEKITGNKFIELDEIFISKKNIRFQVLPKNIVQLYACADSPNAVELFEHLEAQVPDSMWPIILIEMRLADLKADQEFYGMRVNVKKYKDNYENCCYVLDLLLNLFRKMTHEDGNINSSEVLSTLLYDKLGCKVLLRTKTGKRSTSGKAIDKLASLKAEKPYDITEDVVDKYGKTVIKAEKLANSKYPALVVLSKYREYNKRKTAFYARFERTLKVGRIAFWINQNGASSGRQSSPMHQLPPELKDVMLSDSEYKDLWGPDYSQIELRMIAYLAGETDLKEMCCDFDNDVHRVCASLITGKEMWEITKAERNIKKRVNFGVVYLISEYGLAGQLYGPGYTDEQVAFCREQLDAFYKRFKRIDLYLKKNAIKVKTNGYMKTAFGRIKYFKEIFNPDITNKKRASIVRQSNNMPVQGTAADIMKIGEVNMDEYIRSRGWNELDKDGFPKVRVMLSIHDEALISASQEIPMEEIIEMISTCMQIEVKDAPPFFVAPAKMDNWGGHSDDALAIPVPYRDQLISDYHKNGRSVFRRSFYNVSLPAEINERLNLDTSRIDDKVAKYLPYAVFTKVSGDYSDELSEKAKKEALTAYIESASTRYIDENYLSLLNEYRDGVLRNYMMGLYEKYGPDLHDVGMHVRHPSLTHDLIAEFSKEMAGMDLTHVEQINFAAKLYMEKLLGGEDVVTSIVENTVEERRQMDEQLLMEQVEDIYQFDKDGNIVYMEPDNAEDNDEDAISDSDMNYILFRSEGKIYKAWKMVNNIVLDVDALNMNDIDVLIAECWKHRDPNGFYNMYLLTGGRMVNMKFKVEDLNLDEISDLIVKLERSVS